MGSPPGDGMVRPPGREGDASVYHSSGVDANPPQIKDFSGKRAKKLKVPSVQNVNFVI